MARASLHGAKLGERVVTYRGGEERTWWGWWMGSVSFSKGYTVTDEGFGFAVVDRIKIFTL